MNPLLLIGGAVLAVGLLGLLVSVLLRPGGSKAHLTVADLQARLAHEQSATSPEPDGSDEPVADQLHTDDAQADPARPEADEPRTNGPRAGTGNPAEAPEARADQVLLPDHRRRAE
ncbi:hypothetical protein LTT66_19140 [Nocardia gipuzkoensis]|uniref:hypothetical protein n=1 Tax=Nocardia gipuzkoensis TaxID=2749991 RepID=UPI001E39E2B7|nr:hypothetical protein [Nocardia gipuzkoensis]UGT65471.1 hypothetical protein LTT66_19140 [Nocardia gipuzkoensis]